MTWTVCDFVRAPALGSRASRRFYLCLNESHPSKATPQIRAPPSSLPVLTPMSWAESEPTVLKVFITLFSVQSLIFLRFFRKNPIYCCAVRGLSPPSHCKTHFFFFSLPTRSNSPHGQMCYSISRLGQLVSLHPAKSRLSLSGCMLVRMVAKPSDPGL